MSFDISNSLTDPKTFVETGGGAQRFQKGILLVVDSAYEVYKANDPKPKADGTPSTMRAPEPHIAHYIKGQLLDENQAPMVNDEGENIFEEFHFGLGGKSLLKLRPANADKPGGPSEFAGDNDGSVIGARGPTLKLADENAPDGDVKKFTGLDIRSAASVFYSSLVQANIRPDALKPTWAPSLIGAIIEIWPVTHFVHKPKDGAPPPALVFGEDIPRTAMPIMQSDDRQGKPNQYRAVCKIHRQPTGKLETGKKSKAQGQGAGTSAPASAPAASAPVASGGGGGNGHQKLIHEALLAVSAGNRGKALSGTAFSKLMSPLLTQNGAVALTQDLINATKATYRSPAWMTANAAGYGISFTEAGGKVDSVKFDLEVTAGAEGGEDADPLAD